MADIKENTTTMRQHEHHIEAMRKTFVEDRWAELTRVNDEADLFRLTTKCRDAGMYGLATDIEKEWRRQLAQNLQDHSEARNEYQQSQGWPYRFGFL